MLFSKKRRGNMLREVKAVEHDYHSEDKSITINEAEAVRLIFNLYLQGYRAYRIAKELSRLGKVNKKRDYEHSDQYFHFRIPWKNHELCPK